MNDRKVKGKPHIEAKQWAGIINCDKPDLLGKIANSFVWFDTPQKESFWCETVDKIEARGR